jgi:hypothetical protein
MGLAVGGTNRAPTLPARFFGYFVFALAFFYNSRNAFKFARLDAKMFDGFGAVNSAIHCGVGFMSFSYVARSSEIFCINSSRVINLSQPGVSLVRQSARGLRPEVLPT